MILYAVRHAEYKNPEKIIPFRLPGFPLSENGIKQAQKLADFFSGKNISAVYSSPQLRARQTAEIIAERCGLEVIISELINETRSPLQGISFSDFKGNPFTDPRHKDGGETPDEIFDRMYQFVLEVLHKHSKENTVFVSHGDPIELLKKGLQGEPLEYGNLTDKTGRIIGKGNVYEFVFRKDNLERVGKLEVHN